VTFYTWYWPTGSRVINLATNLDTIYNDMLRFVVAGAHGSKATIAQGRQLGELISLDYTIQMEFSRIAEEEGRSQNIEQAKVIFNEQLDRVKVTSLTEALEEMQLDKWENLGDYGDIKLDESGDKLNQFKMIAYSSKDKKIQALNNRYEEDFDTFKGVMKLKGSDFKIFNVDHPKPKPTPEFTFNFTIEYNETPQYNKKQLENLGFENTRMKKFNPKVIATPIEDSRILSYEDALIMYNKGQLQDKILEFIYENLKELSKNVEIKNVILNPRYVTKFSIKNGTYKGTHDEKGKIKYTMDIETTHKLPSETFEARGPRPAGKYGLSDTKKKLREQSMRAEERTNLIDKVKERIARLDRAIEELE
jgi:phage pi2 protein 07